ncbi:tektin-2-like isoform X2 [Polyodon spathula]|uniref:tektin-2-like isoform X2 n=1 Tax=Polyodon spathula TaxID=7913 RepID=UPI001B7DF5F0|nr:tektin-2-like isoform X2 [Polyodon spathula]
MSSLRVKPGQRLTMLDWHTNSHLISSNAERQRWGSHCTRQEARGLRYETSNKSKWDEQDTCTRLSDRIDEVTKWKDSLLKCLDDVDTEIKALSIVKESTEKALAATSLPLDVAIECLTLREGRCGNDLVRDPVEAELHKEVEVIDRARKVLQQKVSQAIEQLCLLQEVWQQLTFDLWQKNEALDVDQSCLSLNVNSAGLSLKLSPSRVPPWSVRLRRSPQSGVWSLRSSTYLSINRDSSTKARRWQDYEQSLCLLSLDDMEQLATHMLHPEAVECMELSLLD